MRDSHLLAKDKLMEVIELLSVDSSKELAAMEVLSGSETHRRKTDLTELLEELAGRLLAGLLDADGLGPDILVDELPSLLLETTVRLLVVGVLELRDKPARFRVLLPCQGLNGNTNDARRGWWTYRNDIGITRFPPQDLGGLALDGADDKVGVLLKDFVTVHLVEVLGGILASDGLEDVLTTRVGHSELGHIVDLGVDDDVEGVFGVVLRDLENGEGAG